MNLCTLSHVQPTPRNPFSLTMPVRRFDQLADVLLTSGIYVIEDAVRAFFRDGCRGEARTATCAASRLFTAGLDRRTGVRE